MLEKLRLVEERYMEMEERAAQPDFYADPKILAAPIALDLVIFSDLALRAGMSGIQTWLSFFCKSPMHDFEHEPIHDLFTQWRMVKETIRTMVGEKSPSYLD